MAGPEIAVVTREIVSIADAVEAASRLGVWKPGEQEGDGWLDGRPIAFVHDDDPWEDDDEAALRVLKTMLGWEPSVPSLVIVAMCNSPRDHELLAQVALEVLDGRQGAVDLDGEPPDVPMDLPGWVVHVRYRTVNEADAFHAVASREWLFGWMADQAFRLVK